MTHFKSIFATLVALAGISQNAFANSNQESEPPKDVAQMQRLIGEWSGSAEIKMGKDKLEVNVTMSCESTSAGFGVLCKSRFTGLPTGAHEETDLFGYDPGQNKYHWFSVTNDGETHDHVADVSKTGTLNWIYKGKMDSKPFTESVAMTVNKPGTRIKLACKAKVGKKTLYTMSGAIRKRKR